MLDHQKNHWHPTAAPKPRTSFVEPYGNCQRAPESAYSPRPLQFWMQLCWIVKKQMLLGTDATSWQMQASIWLFPHQFWIICNPGPLKRRSWVVTFKIMRFGIQSGELLWKVNFEWIISKLFSTDSTTFGATYKVLQEIHVHQFYKWKKAKNAGDQPSLMQLKFFCTLLVSMVISS